MNKKYLVSFIEEAVRIEYEGWVGGRMEVLIPDEWPYSIEEVRFFTHRNDEWAQFVEKWDLKKIDKATLEEVIKTVREKFCTR